MVILSNHAAISFPQQRSLPQRDCRAALAKTITRCAGKDNNLNMNSYAGESGQCVYLTLC